MDNTTNVCKNCKSWNYMNITNNKDNYRPCNNEIAFKGKPKSLHQAKSLLDGDLNSVLILNYDLNRFSTDENDYVLTGENFGCIHFSKRD